MKYCSYFIDEAQGSFNFQVLDSGLHNRSTNAINSNPDLFKATFLTTMLKSSAPGSVQPFENHKSNHLY